MIVWQTFLHLLKNEKTWTVVSAVASSLAAIAALITVKLLINARKEELEVKRPYFTISKPGIKQLPNSPPYRIQITMENVGVHIAQNNKINIYFIDSALAREPDHSNEHSIANDIPPNSPTPWYVDTLLLPPNMPPKYIVVMIEYEDPILKKKYSQRFYMKWSGVENGKTHPHFTHVDIEEKKRIIQYFEQHLKPGK